MKIVDDLTGIRFGRLVVARRVPNVTKGNTIWLCKCDCGAESIVQSGALKRGVTQSCGCLQRSVVTSHGLEGSKTYHAWAAMKQRCSNPNNKFFSDYGGRGISYCSEWESFEGFLSDMGDKPFGLSLERIDNSQGYFPSNCRWATQKEQRRNTRATVFLEFQGVRKSRTEWAEELGISPITIKSRMALGWSVEDILFKPIDKRKATKQKAD